MSRIRALSVPSVQHTAALRSGWNDAAWSQPRREIETAVALWHERGYTGGLVFRRKQEEKHTGIGVVSRLPRVVPAA